MAELIKKTELIEALVLSHTAHANNSREASLLNRDVLIVMEQPVTTEAEIRAKAIDEFAEKLKAQSENLETAIDVFGGSNGQVICETVDEIAEQLKGE